MNNYLTFEPVSNVVKTDIEYQFDNFTAVMIAEGELPAESEEHYIAAWQYLIDTGLCWTLQGFFGRGAMALIEQGVCHD